MTTSSLFSFRKAAAYDVDRICEIIAYAKVQRRLQGSTQWQDGYPNRNTVEQDVAKQIGYVLTEEDFVLAYEAIIFDREPAYEALSSGWLTNGDNYAVLHRMAVAKEGKGKRLGQLLLRKAEEIVKLKDCKSLRIDTNFDNKPMLTILEKFGYTYCGKVYFRGSARKAFEKKL